MHKGGGRKSGHFHLPCGGGPGWRGGSIGSSAADVRGLRPPTQPFPTRGEGARSPELIDSCASWNDIATRKQGESPDRACGLVEAARGVAESERLPEVPAPNEANAVPQAVGPPGVWGACDLD